MRTRVITYLVLSRHSGSVYYRLDQIIILRTTKQFFSSSLWKSSSLYAWASIHRRHIPATCLVGCELHGLHEWATTWLPVTEQYMSYQGWAICHWAIKEYHLHIQACLPCVLFCVCACCALLWSAVFSKTCCCCCCIMVLSGWLGSARRRPLYSSYNFHNVRTSPCIRSASVKNSFFFMCLRCCCM